MRASFAIPAVLALFLTGCPGFTDEWSGTYRQILADDEQPDQYVEVEVFRFGHDLQALVRFYEPPDPSGEPGAFETELRCGWTDPTLLDDDASFETIVRNSAPQTSLIGEFADTGELRLRLKSPSEKTDLVLNQVDIEPDSECLTIAPRLMVADFAGRTGANEFDAGVYNLRAPYFGIQWLAVEPVKKAGGLTVYAALTADLVAASVEDKVTENRRGLAGALSIPVEPPPEDFRTASGSTRYSLAHFIVVDDDPDDVGPFVWDKQDEPIVASGVRRGTRPDAPDFVGEHNQFGRAVLFVEGSINQLDPALRAVMEGWDEVAPDEHLYVVQVFARDDRVTGIRFADSTENEVPVIVVPDYLDAAQIPLPRLLPLN